MGFLDTIRERLNLGSDDDFYDDEEEYEDYYDEGEPAEPARDTSGILGNTRRPEAESVSVYTRSGRPVGSNAGASSAGYGIPVDSDSYAPDYRPRSGQGAAAALTGGDAGAPSMARAASAQLPPYVLRPVAYDDVQMVVRRVRTRQPVVLLFKNTGMDVAKRILDFSFGFSAGIGGSVEQLGDRAFVVLPAGVSLGQAEIDKLVADDVITR